MEKRHFLPTFSRASMFMEPTLVFFLSKAFSPAATWWQSCVTAKLTNLRQTSCLLFLPELLCPVVRMVTSTWDEDYASYPWNGWNYFSEMKGVIRFSPCQRDGGWVMTFFEMLRIISPGAAMIRKYSSGVEISSPCQWEDQWRTAWALLCGAAPLPPHPRAPPGCWTSSWKFQLELCPIPCWVLPGMSFRKPDERLQLPRIRSNLSTPCSNLDVRLAYNFIKCHSQITKLNVKTFRIST